MKMWLISFPRSGNTFFRLLMNRFHGFTSSTYEGLFQPLIEADWMDKDLVKSHRLPHELPSPLGAPVVYLLRDGRDSVVSVAHHRRDLVAPGSDLLSNMAEATIAAGGSFFGGWGRNVREWVPRADLVIRFEDLITQPLVELAKVEALLGLPTRKNLSVPTLDEIKADPAIYAPVDRFAARQAKKPDMIRSIFRKGQIGGWKTEMPADMAKLFLELNSRELILHGYEAPDALDSVYHVGIECGALSDNVHDGGRRYVETLVEELRRQADPQRWVFYSFRPGEGLLALNPAFQTPAARWARRWFPLYHAIRFMRHKAPWAPVREWLRGGEARTRAWAEAVTIEQFKRLNHRANHHACFHLPLPNGAVHSAWASGIEWVTTVLDPCPVSSPETQTEIKKSFLDKGLQTAANAGSRWIFPSDFIRRRFMDLMPTARDDNSRIIPLIASAVFRRPTDRLDPPVQRRHFLVVGTVEPHNHYRLALHAFERSGLAAKGWKLGVVGTPGRKADEVPQEETLPDGVEFAGPVDDEALANLYTGAQALLFPSIHEGFGLPALEAMSCGTPVCCLAGTAVAEVVGGTGRELPHDVDAWAEALRDLARPGGPREELSRRALERSREFTPARFIEQTLAVYHEAMCHSTITKLQQKYILASGPGRQG